MSLILRSVASRESCGPAWRLCTGPVCLARAGTLWHAVSCGGSSARGRANDLQPGLPRRVRHPRRNRGRPRRPLARRLSPSRDARLPLLPDPALSQAAVRTRTSPAAADPARRPLRAGDARRGARPLRARTPAHPRRERSRCNSALSKRRLTWAAQRGDRPFLRSFRPGHDQAWRYLFGSGRCRAARRFRGFRQQ